MEGLGMSRDFWRGKRVFITGHTGFKGSWLSLWLQGLGAELTGYALPPPDDPCLYQLAKVGAGMRSVIADIRDADTLTKAMREVRPEIVFHLAAQPLVSCSYSDPVTTYSTNVMGTVHLLEAVRQTGGVRALVNVTSDKCYENKEWSWGYREIDALGGYDPYSSSKGCAELVTAAYRNSFFNSADYANHGLAIASARAGNVIGGGDWAQNRLIPDMLRAIAAKQQMVIRSPLAIRPWQHVLEPLNGYLLLAKQLYIEGPNYAESWNFGPKDEDAKSVQWVIEHFMQIWGEQSSAWKLDESPHVHEANYLKLDCSKAHLKLGWYPQWDLGAALQRVVAWHKSAEQQAAMQTVCFQQISEYTNAAMNEQQLL